MSRPLTAMTLLMEGTTSNLSRVVYVWVRRGRPCVHYRGREIMVSATG